MDCARKPRGYRADTAYSHADIEDIVIRRRARLFTALTPEDRLPEGVELLETLEKLSVHLNGKEYPIRTEVKPLPWPVEAESRFDEDEQAFIIRVSEETYKALTRNDPHARFTVCHEYGHIVLHKAQLVRLSCIPHATAALQRKKAPEHPIYRDTEWQADSFAASMLAPTKGLHRLWNELGGTLTTAAVVARYGVSPKSATIRISNFRRYELDEED